MLPFKLYEQAFLLLGFGSIPMLVACYMVYRALDIKNSNFAKIKCFVVIILAIQNLTEYLNRNYISDKNLEEEVSIMTKSLYDPEVEKRGIEIGRKVR